MYAAFNNSFIAYLGLPLVNDSYAPPCYPAIAHREKRYLSVLIIKQTQMKIKFRDANIHLKALHTRCAKRPTNDHSGQPRVQWRERAQWIDSKARLIVWISGRG